jgi:transposase-like protein
MQPTRRSYSKSFKAQVIEECVQHGASTGIRPVAYTNNGARIFEYQR